MEAEDRNISKKGEDQQEEGREGRKGHCATRMNRNKSDVVKSITLYQGK